MNRHKFVSACSLGLALSLSACGGSDGGIASTPPPTYTKLGDLTGNQTFQSAGVHINYSSAGFSNGARDAFGSGVVYAYNQSTDSFTVTTPGGSPVSFASTDYKPGEGLPSQQIFRKGDGPTAQQLTLTTATVDGVALSYTVAVNFLDGLTSTSWVTTTGIPTFKSDMPKSGTATYKVGLGGTVAVPGNPQVSRFYTMSGATTATFSADFGAGTVATSMSLFGNDPSGSVSFGTFNGTGSITSGGPGFAGTFADTTGPGFSGEFNGPQAKEIGYSFNFQTDTIQVVGGALGIKQ